MLQIPFIDLQTQYQHYKQEIDTAIAGVLDSSQYILGSANAKLESELSSYIGSKYSLVCSSGTDGLLLALMAYDIKAGDEVITTPFTFIATAEVVSLLGAKPVFVDIEDITYNLDPSKLEQAITPKTKAIIPVSIFGQTSDMDAINAIAKDRGIPVIEDACQSFGATYKGKKSCNLSQIGVTSFFPSKPLGCYGDGGALFTNDESLANRLRMLLNHGQKERYKHQIIGINGRLDSLQCAILSVKLKHFSEELQKRAQIAKVYLENLKGVTLPQVKPENTSVFAQFSILSQKREKLIAHLKEKNIPTAIHYPIPLHLQEVFLPLGYKVGDFKVAERISNEVLSLPFSPFLNPKHQEYIIQTINSFHV